MSVSSTTTRRPRRVSRTLPLRTRRAGRSNIVVDRHGAHLGPPGEVAVSRRVVSASRPVLVAATDSPRGPVSDSHSIRCSIEHVYDVRAGVRTIQGPDRTSVRTACRDTPFEHVFEQTGSGWLPCSHGHEEGLQPRRAHHGQRAARRTSGRDRAHPASAARPRAHQGLHRASRLSPEHARDRRGGRAHQLLQRRPPAQDAGGEGLPQARPQPAPGPRGLPARGDGGPPLPRPRRRDVVRRDRHRRHRPGRLRTSRWSAGSPPADRSWPSRPTRTSSRCRSSWWARESSSCWRSPASR